MKQVAEVTLRVFWVMINIGNHLLEKPLENLSIYDFKDRLWVKFLYTCWDFFAPVSILQLKFPKKSIR